MRWLVVVVAAVGCSSSAAKPKLVSKAELGEQLFNDPKLSEPAGQACSDCHDAKMSFVDPEFERVSPGVLRERVGTRNSQSAMYAAFTPALHKNESGQMIGGLFWDGRASSLADQAAFPLINPLEMNNPDKATVVAKIKKHYAPQFRHLYGKDALDNVDRAYGHIGDAIAEFERTPQFAPFAS